MTVKTLSIPYNRARKAKQKQTQITQFGIINIAMKTVAFIGILYMF